MKTKFIPYYVFATACALSTSAFASNISVNIPAYFKKTDAETGVVTYTQGSYLPVNGTNNKVTAAVGEGFTSFKKGFHLGSSNTSLNELDVSVGAGFTLETGFFYNKDMTEMSVANGATITIGNRLVDGIRVFDEGTLKMSGGNSSTELWFRGEDRDAAAEYHIGTQQEMKMAGIKTNVEKNNIVHLYNASFRSNAQVYVDATSELYIHLTTIKESNKNLSVKFGTSTWAGKFVVSGWKDNADVAYNTSDSWFHFDGTNTITGQLKANGSTFGNVNSKMRMSGTVYVTGCEEGSVRLGTSSSGTITINEYATLKLASSNAFAANDSNGQDKVGIEVVGNANTFAKASRLVLEKTAEGVQTENDFSKIMITAATKFMRITLGGNKLNIGFFQASSENEIGKVYIEDFAEGLFKVNEIADTFLDKENGNKISFMFAGTETDNDALYWDNATGFITASPVVPEPATVAAIFGALALAFVAYKRRK